METLVLSEKNAIKYGMESHEEKTVLVSITDRLSESAPIIMTADNNIQDILFMKFNDTGDRDYASGRITEEEGKTIAYFVKKHIEAGIEKIVVNCGAGQSRSAGVAAALLLYYNHDDSYAYGEDRKPNALVKEMVLHGLEGDKDYADIFGALAEE